MPLSKYFELSFLFTILAGHPAALTGSSSIPFKFDWDKTDAEMTDDQNDEDPLMSFGSGVK